MWSKAKDKKVTIERHASNTTLIAQGTVISGDVHFTGGLQVDGTIKGNIIADDDVDALVRLSESGVVEGELRVPNVVVNGHVTGDVVSTGHVELAAKAVVMGNVHYKLIEMVMGAEVNGALMHTPASATYESPSLQSDVDGAGAAYSAD